MNNVAAVTAAPCFNGWSGQGTLCCTFVNLAAHFGFIVRNLQESPVTQVAFTQPHRDLTFIDCDGATAINN
jgi:hypothetical protein